MSEEMEGSNWYQGIRLGMPVFDVNGEVVGRVEKVHTGYDIPGIPRTDSDADEAISDAFEETFDPVDELDEELLEDLYRGGFIRVEGPNLLGSDRYVETENIAEVSPEGVHLNVRADEVRKNI